VSNSKHLVFNSAQQTLYGNATNWNGTGYDLVMETMRKFMLKSLTNSVMMSTVQCNDKNQKTFYIRTRF